MEVRCKKMAITLSRILLLWTILFFGIGTGAPFCQPDSDCSCQVDDLCTVCSEGLGQSRWAKLDPSQFSSHVTCLKLLKGFATELKVLQITDQLFDLEIHKYLLPTLSRDFLPIYRNKNLTHLNISGNGIHSLEEESLYYLESLRHLDLSHNQIQHLPPEFFAFLQHLESLHLEDNLLTSIPPLAFAHLIHLSILNLHDNKIEYVHHEQFLNLTSLKILDMSRNKLKGLPDDVLQLFPHLQILKFNKNPWDCSCSVHTVAGFLQNNDTFGIHIEEPRCRTPDSYEGMALSELTLADVTCSQPMITFISDSEDFVYGAEFTLKCEATGHPTPAILWTLPTGDIFGHPSGYHLLGKSHLVKVISENLYVFSDHFQSSHVTSRINGELTVDGMRGALSGNYSCIAVNPAGIDTGNLTMYVHTGIPTAFAGSLIFTAMISGGFIGLAFIIGITICVIEKCQKRRKTKPKSVTDEVETMDSASIEIQDSIGDFDEDYPSSDGSPMLSGRMSPTKSKTLSSEEYDKFAPDFQENVRETLDDVRWRLRHGVERKLERVRTQVQTIKSSGSQYMDTLRSSSSNAANRVRAGVVMGMEQVKYGVQSIKEFCGTGDMGTQTISTISVSTNVDTQQSIETIKTICMTDV